MFTHILVTFLLTFLILYVYFNFKYRKINQLLLEKKGYSNKLRDKYKFLLIKNSTLEISYAEGIQKIKSLEKERATLTKKLNESSDNNDAIVAKNNILEKYKLKAAIDLQNCKTENKQLKSLQFQYLELEKNYQELQLKYLRQTKELNQYKK